MCTFCTTAFYLLSRLIGFFLAVSSNNENLYNTADTEIMLYLLNAISIIIPRLDLYTKSDWLIYDIYSQKDLILPVIQSIIYIPMLFSISLYDINRKQF